MNAKNTVSPARLATVNGARENKDTTNAPTIRPEPQPRDGPSISPNVSTPTPAVVSTAPVQSKRRSAGAREITGMNRTPNTTTVAASGTLSRNTERQPIVSVSRPPTAGPTASASPEPADQTLIAVA